MTKKLKLKDLKKVAKELEEIVVPLDDDDDPIDLAEGKAKDIKKSILKAAEMLEEDDKDDMSDELTETLTTLGFDFSTVFPDDEEPEDESEDDEEPENESENEKGEFTWEQISKMRKKGLINLCEEEVLLVDPDDYEKIGDLRMAIAEELEVDIPEEKDNKKTKKEKAKAEKEKKKKDKKGKTKDKKEKKKKNGKETGKTEEKDGTQKEIVKEIAGLLNKLAELL